MHRHAHRILKADPVMAALIEAAGPCRLQSRRAARAVRGAGARHRASATARRRRREHSRALRGAVRRAGLSARRSRCSRRRTSSCAPSVSRPPRSPRSRTWRPRPSKAWCRRAAELALLSDLEIIERLSRVRGIGRWTVEMMLMFQLERRDVLPVDDFGVRNGFRLAYGLEACRRRAHWRSSASAGNPIAASPPGTCGARSSSRAMVGCRNARVRRASHWSSAAKSAAKRAGRAAPYGRAQSPRRDAKRAAARRAAVAHAGGRCATPSGCSAEHAVFDLQNLAVGGVDQQRVIAIAHPLDIQRAALPEKTASSQHSTYCGAQ